MDTSNAFSIRRAISGDNATFSLTRSDKVARRTSRIFDESSESPMLDAAYIHIDKRTVLPYCGQQRMGSKIIGRNNALTIHSPRRIAEPTGPPSERVRATYGALLWLFSLDLRAECIAIGSGKLRDLPSAAIVLTDHTGHPSESAQLCRLTRTSSSRRATPQAIIVDRISAGKYFLRGTSERTLTLRAAGNRARGLRSCLPETLAERRES